MTMRTLIILLLAGCSMTRALRADVQIVAHRGASAEAPENTLASFKLAWEQGADAIEGDYWLTRDAKVICLHDNTFERTAGTKAAVADLTLEQVRQLDAGKWKAEKYAGEKVPTLAEVLATVPAGKRAFVEIKDGPAIVPEIKRVIDASGLKAEQIVFISFKEKSLAAMKKAMPQCKAQLLYGFKKKEDGQWNLAPDALIERAKSLGFDGVDVGFYPETLEIMNDDFARKVRAAGLEFHVYTVDDPGLARRALKLGVDSITTNRPGALRKELAG